jgi:hypothetical protein
MGKRSKLIALTAVGALALAVSVAVAASGTTQSKITAGLSPNNGGKPTRIKFDVKTFTTTGAVPAPGSNAVVHLPKGMKFAFTGITRCTGNLQNPPSAANCPAKSQVGGGSATVEAQLGTIHFLENATVTAYVGAKQHGHDTLLLYANGTTPVSTQITLVGELIPGDASPYAYKLNVPIPPVATVTGGPNASITDFSTTVGATVKVKGKKTGLVTAPKKSNCVGGVLKWGYDGTYQDGTSYTSTTTSPCPKK